MLTRPDLAPLAMILAAVVAANRPRVPRLALFAAGLDTGRTPRRGDQRAPVRIAAGVGYGPLSGFYAWDRWRENAAICGWLVELNSPACCWRWPRRSSPAYGSRSACSRSSSRCSACYVFYIVYDTWPFLRFLLPAFRSSSSSPARFSSAASKAAGFAPGRGGVAALRPAADLVRGQSRQMAVFDIQRAERRYPAVGAEVGRRCRRTRSC